MHWQPQPHLGLHPAFPEPHPRASTHPVLQVLPWAGLPVLVPIVGSLALRRPVAWQWASQFAAYSLISTTLYGLSIGFLEQQRAKAFLREQNIEIPKPRLIPERIGYIDADDFLVCGTIVGGVLATTYHRPSSVTGWKRGAAAVAFGAFAGRSLSSIRSLVAARSSEDWRAEAAEYSERSVQAQRWTIEVNMASARAALATKARFSRAFATPFRPSMPVPNQLAPFPQSTELPKAMPPSEKIGTDVKSWPNMSNEPHLTNKDSHRTPLDAAPVPYANTNYLWTPEPGQAVSQLNAHIESLRKQRQKIATEAENMWQQLANKEAAYYALDESSVELDEKTKARRYLEFIGTLHSKLWMEVSKVDWMIADSKKRIAQLESTGEGKNIVSAPLAPGPSPAELYYSKLLVDRWREEISARRNIVQQTNLLMKEDVPTQKVRDPETGEWHDMKELMTKVVKADLINVAFDEEVVANVVQDVHQWSRDKEGHDP